MCDIALDKYPKESRKKRMKPSLVLLLLPVVTAFSAVAPQARANSVHEGDGSGSIKNKNQKRLNFHQVLQRVGKTVFRPGGSEATMVMHEWVDLRPGGRALEMSAGLGTGGMALAKRFQANVVLADQDQDRLKLAQKLARERGVEDLIEVRQLDMRKIAETLDPVTERFDAVVVEASLSHQPDIMKENILKDLKQHTNQILLHEIGLRDCDEQRGLEIKRQMGSALAIGFYPLALDKWRDLLDRNGYVITHLEHGPIRVLNPKNLLQDEGPKGVAKIAWNLIRNPELRDRVRSTKAIVDSHKDTLGFIILRAVKKETLVQ